MLRELIHLARHAPATLALKKKSSQVDLYDTVIQRADDAGFRERRARLVSDLRGDVLEIGCGTGFTFAHYDERARVRAIDIDDDFLERARTRARPNVTIARGDAQLLAFEDESFDAVVVCLVLCSVPDAARVLAECKRVLRKGGELRAIEHVISEGAIAAPLMRAVDPLWLRLNEQGCHMDRDTLRDVRGVFDDVVLVERFQIFSAGLPAFPMVTIAAKRPSM
jgi:SAM-dependent methyltransferase